MRPQIWPLHFYRYEEATGATQKSNACTISKVGLRKDGHEEDIRLHHRASGEMSPIVLTALMALMREWMSSPYSDRESSVSCDDVICAGTISK